MGGADVSGQGLMAEAKKYEKNLLKASISLSPC
jgi:hypothetical protein